LVDKAAIRSACGVGDGFDLSFVPDAANAIENISDPKKAMYQIQDALSRGARGRKPPIPYETLGQLQDLDRLRALPSFNSFERELVGALRTLGYPNLV
jgi:hypothetical protein